MLSQQSRARYKDQGLKLSFRQFSWIGKQWESRMMSQFYQFFCQMLPTCPNFGGYFRKVIRIITRWSRKGFDRTLNDATRLQAIGAGSSESKMTHVNKSYLWVITTAKKVNLRTTLFLHQKVCIQINILYQTTILYISRRLKLGKCPKTSHITV